MRNNEQIKNFFTLKLGICYIISPTFKTSGIVISSLTTESKWQALTLGVICVLCLKLILVLILDLSFRTIRWTIKVSTKLLKTIANFHKNNFKLIAGKSISRPNNLFPRFTWWMSLLITCSDYFQNYSSEENFSGQNKPRIVINEKRTRVTRACIHGDMVEICLDHALCLHHDASTYDSYLRLLLTTRTYDSWFWKTLKTNNKKSKALIENWRSLCSPYFWNQPPK